MDAQKLCREVAVKVMGWEEHDIAWLTNPFEGQAYWERVWSSGLRLTPDDAMRVVEAMRARGYGYSAEQNPPAEHLDSSVWVRFRKLGHVSSAEGTTFPEAVFRAALAAVEGM